MAYAIELILTRQLADCLAIPVFITDTIGNLLFYNEPAEDILGKRFEDTGEMPVENGELFLKIKMKPANHSVRRTSFGKNIDEPVALS